MKNEIISLTKEQLLRYVFSELSEEEEKAITEILSKNDDERETVEFLVDLSLEKDFNREHLEEYLKVNSFKI